MTQRAPVVLLWGEDAFLLREAALELVGPDERVTEVDAREWQGGELADLQTPSLFGERRVLIVTECKSLPAAALEALAAYLGLPSAEATLVLLARVGERGTVPAKLRKLVEPVGEVREVRVARKDLASWVVARARHKGMDLEGAAARALIGSLGEDPAELDQALDQLANAFPQATITPARVAEQFRGLGEQQVWDLCDRAFARDLSGAVRALRSLLVSRDDPIVILGGIAARVRDLLKVKSLPERLPAAEVARKAGLRFPWQGGRYAEQARRFSLEDLVAIHAALVEADRALKSGGNGDVVLSSLVTRIAATPMPS